MTYDPETWFKVTAFLYPRAFIVWLFWADWASGGENNVWITFFFTLNWPLIWSGSCTAFTPRHSLGEVWSRFCWEGDKWVRKYILYKWYLKINCVQVVQWTKHLFLTTATWVWSPWWTVIMWKGMVVARMDIQVFSRHSSFLPHQWAPHANICANERYFNCCKIKFSKKKKDSLHTH